MIRRSFDASEINEILNDPEVFKWIKLPGIESVDVTSAVRNPANVLLMADGGGIIFFQHEPGVYEVHTAFLPSARGRHAIRASRATYRWMFTHTDCMILRTKVPAFNKQAEMFCKIVGAVRDFDRKAVWPWEGGLVDMSYWTLSYEDWLRKAEGLTESGKRFHDRLEQLGIAADHEDEECHDRYVGVCAEMIYGGQPEKAVILYNRWCRFSGYAPIQIISRYPLLIDIGTAVLRIGDNNFEVVNCP